MFNHHLRLKNKQQTDSYNVSHYFKTWILLFEINHTKMWRQATIVVTTSVNFKIALNFKMRSNWAYHHFLYLFSTTNIRNQGHIWLSTPDFYGVAVVGHQNCLAWEINYFFLFFSSQKMAKNKISPSWRVVKLIKWTCHFVDGPRSLTRLGLKNLRS